MELMRKGIQKFISLGYFYALMNPCHILEIPFNVLGIACNLFQKYS